VRAGRAVVLERLPTRVLDEVDHVWDVAHCVPRACHRIIPSQERLELLRRIEIEKLVPVGLVGLSLKLVSTLGISRDEAQWCHKAIFDEIAYMAALCERDIRLLRDWRFISLADTKTAGRGCGRVRRDTHTGGNNFSGM